MAAEKKKRDVNRKLFIAAAVLLCLVLIGEVIFFVTRISTKRESSTLDASTILHELNRGAYMDALYSVRYNRAAGLTEEKDPDYALPYAAADYYEAASYYLAYSKCGQEEQARVWREKMEAARDRMGELQFLTEDMNAELRLAE